MPGIYVIEPADPEGKREDVRFIAYAPRGAGNVVRFPQDAPPVTVPVAFLVSADYSPDVLTALAGAGTDAQTAVFVCWEDDALTLRHGLAAAAAGRSFRSPRLTLPRSEQECPVDPPAAELSDREREVIELAMAGLSNQEIASRLFVSINTVKAHLKRTFHKLGVHRRSQLAGWRMAGGLWAERQTDKV